MVAVPTAHATSPTNDQPRLRIAQAKITTSGQFITLYNPTEAAIDLSRVKLQYFNHYEIEKATSSRTISLSGSLLPGAYHQILDDQVIVCGERTVSAVSLGFATTAGQLQVISYPPTGPGTTYTPIMHDHVAWSKSAVSSAQTLPTVSGSYLQRQIADADEQAIATPGVGSWQHVVPDPDDPCATRLIVAGKLTPAAAVLPGFTLLPGQEPDAEMRELVLEDAKPSGNPPVMPSENLGLAAPRITELLPNPTGTGNDATDEFIELYNANAKAFTLTGFKLVTGLKTLRVYVFPEGSVLPARSYVAFSADDTRLSLSNTSSQVRLFDPLDREIAASNIYSKAKDGQAWALGGGTWQWSLQATPGSKNVLVTPAPPKKKQHKTTASKKFSPSSTQPKVTGATNKTATYNNMPVEEAGGMPVSSRLLALIIGGAVLYVAYEYRTDLGNRFAAVRGYARRRRDHRAKT